MYYIPQIHSNDCLFTAFKILLANIKDDERYLYLPEDEKRGPYSLLEIIEKGKTFGVDLLGFESENKIELKNFNEFPLILNIKRGEKGLHSVYVYKIRNNTVYFLDSDIGKGKMTFDKFISLWDGTGLMVKGNDKNIEKPNVNVVAAKHSCFSRIFQVLSAICFIVGIYFIDDETNVLIPILCLSVGALLEILTKVVQLKDMKKFDFDTMHLLDMVKAKNYSEFLPRREKLKENLFSEKNNYFFYILCCIFVIFVVLMNNPYNIGCVFVPIILAVIQCLIIHPIENKRKFEIELLEVKFSKEKNSVSAAQTLRKIHDGCYEFSYFTFGKYIVGILLFFIAGFVTLFLLDALNLINIFFLLFTEVFLYENLLPIFLYESRKMDEKVNYMRFINLLQ